LRDRSRFQEFPFDPLLDFVSHASEHSNSFVMRSDCLGGILKAPVQEFVRARKYWTTLFGVIADRDHVGYGLAEKLIYALRCLLRNINANLAHNFDCQRVQTFRLNASTQGLELIAPDMPQVTFRHLASGGISGT
jgi:hypothetical protein